MRGQSTVVKMIVSILIFFVIGYGIFSVRYFILGPNLEINSPNTETISTKNKTFTISGHVDRINHISINDQPINTDENGDFSYTLPLASGHSIITVYAKDKFNREVKRDLWINYTGDDPTLPFFRTTSNQEIDENTDNLETEEVIL